MINRFNHTSGWAALRKKLGLSQEQLAGHLQVHRSTIKLAEKGQRSLPTAALIMAAKLEVIFAAQKPASVFTAIHPEEQASMDTFREQYDQLFQKESICRQNKTKLEKKLADAVSLYQKTRERVALIEAALPGNLNDQVTVQFWQNQYQSAVIILNSCGLLQQALLTCRIAILDAESELYKNLKQQQMDQWPDFFLKTNPEKEPEIHFTSYFITIKNTNTMNYTVSLLTKKPDCQALIDIANAEKDALSYRKTGLERQRSSATLTSAEIETELISVSAEMQALQTVIDNLPDGPTKTEAVRKFKKAEYKKFLLEQRKASYGVVSLLEKEYDIACIEQDIEETVAFITAVTDRMNAL